MRDIEVPRLRRSHASYAILENVVARWIVQILQLEAVEVRLVLSHRGSHYFRV